MGFPDVADDAVYVVVDSVAEVLVLVGDGAFDGAQVQRSFIAVALGLELCPGDLQDRVQVLDSHTGDPVHVNLNIHHQAAKILVQGHLAQQPVVDPPTF